MDYITVQEYADIKGISTRSVQRAIIKGDILVKQVPHPKRKDQISYLVAIPKNGDKPMIMATDNDDTIDDTKMSPFGMTTPNNGDKSESMATHNDDTIDDTLPLPPSVSLPCPSVPFRGQDDTHPSIRIPAPKIRESEFVPYHKMDEAQLFAILMQQIEERLAAADNKTIAWQLITQDFNSRSLVPELRRIKGTRTERALRHWFQKWNDSDNDMFQLIHHNTSIQRGRKVTELEQQYLLRLLLSDKKISIASAINDLKANAELGLIESHTSAPTLKRWVNDWISTHPAEWAQARRGSKYVKDNIVKSIQRDTSMLRVGDVLVIDGHTLAFDVISPITGKPARMTLILLFDWASRYPVGASLALTESSQDVLVAVRNAIMHLGMLPKFILFDNGKAFRSKLFHAKWEDHDLSIEFAGIFPRLGIECEFAEAYNARTKVIERFFRTMQEQFERFQSSFRGRNIDDKPANLSRNEVWAQKLFAGKALTHDEALDLTYYYFRHIYGMQPHQGIGSHRPYEVFAAAERPESRIVAPERLNFLMLKAERKQLRSEGIWLNKCRYYDDALINHVGQPVIIRYDYSDLRWILVYDMRGVEIALASMRESRHGFIYLERDNPIAHQELYAEMRHNKRLQRNIQRSTAQLVKHANKVVDAELAKHQHIKDEIMADIRENNPTFRQAPMIKPPVAKPTVADDIAHLEAIAIRSEAKNSTRSVEVNPDPEEKPAPGKIIVLEDLLDDSEGTLPETTSFNDLQKIIGIKR